MVFQSPNKTGYEINNWVRKLGYNKWAGVGKTSVYNGLNKLITSRCLDSHINSKKTGKGPLPTCYIVTAKGVETLKQDMQETIHTARERDQRFDLTISGLHILSDAEIFAAFTIRKQFLTGEQGRLMKESAEQGDCIPEGGRFLYKRMIISLGSDIEFTDIVLSRYKA